MYPTTYHRARSVSEAVKLISAAEDGKFLSGGMTLIPAMKQRLAAPSDLIDLRHIPEIQGIAISGRSVTIGAATTHAEIAADQRLSAVCPAISHLAAHIGDPHVRNMGTIGGSIANNDPSADYPAAMLALDTTIVTDRREIRAHDFFRGLFETALENGEIVTAVRFTAPLRCAYAKFPNPASRYAIVGVFVAEGEGGVRTAVTGAGDNGVFRSKEIEAALARGFHAAALEGVTISSSDLMSDIHASAEYRAALIMVMAKRAVAAAGD